MEKVDITILSTLNNFFSVALKFVLSFFFCCCFSSICQVIFSFFVHNLIWPNCLSKVGIDLMLVVSHFSLVVFVSCVSLCES